MRGQVGGAGMIEGTKNSGSSQAQWGSSLCQVPTLTETGRNRHVCLEEL